MSRPSLFFYKEEATMFTFLKRFGVSAALVMSLAAVRPSYGQNFIPGVSPFFQIRPGLNISQYAYNTALLGQALQTFPPYALGGAYGTPFGSPYGGFGGYGGVNPYLGAYGSSYGSPYGGGYGGSSGYGSSYDPTYGALKGSAELLTAEGKYITDLQKSLTMREERRGDRLKNDRSAFDLKNYKRERTPGAEELRLRSQKEQVLRSRNNPPLTEITSAKALNDLMQDIHNVQSRGDTAQLRSFQTLLSEETLKRINVTRGQGNIGLLKNEGRLAWPVALNSIDFREDRERINTLLRDAVGQAGFNSQVDSEIISGLMNDTERIGTRLRRNVTELPPSLYIDARAFLNNLDEAIRVLQQPDVGSHFSGRYALKAKTVPELVNTMSAKGLLFASAVPGDEPAYLALHQALASYDRAINPNIEKELAAQR
jgi:hypothetical protein